MQQNTYVAIMAGGVGSRFWPASREDRPKQFLDILGVGKSLIRLTYERFLKLCPSDNIFIVTHKKYKEQVLAHLPELSADQVLCEPSRNNTAPSVAYIAFRMKAMNPAANFVMAPSDHVILKEEEFIAQINKALTFSAQNDALVTLGIEPTRPDTGYGYINYTDKAADGVFKVDSFREKPDVETAKSYLAAGGYVWNAGIFIWKASSILSAFEKYAPEIFTVLKKGEAHYNTATEQDFIDEFYPQTTKISVDFAIMENADNIYTIPADIAWSDMGTWASLHAESTKDEANNLLQGDQLKVYDTKNCLVRAPKGKMVVLGGLEDYIVVDEGDVLIVWPKNKEQEIKAIRGQIKEEDYL